MLNGIKERARALWARFRGRSVYFQLKTLVLLAYGVVVTTTILWAPPSSGARNQIGASILVLPGDPVVGRYFIIQNDGRKHWKAVTFTIDDGYTVRRDLVRAGEKITLYVKDFRKKVVRVRRGRQIPRTLSASVGARIGELRIECSAGVAVEPLSG